MAASNLNLGKASGGVLNIQPADGTTTTSIVLPASGTVTTNEYVNSNNLGNGSTTFNGFGGTGFKNHIINGSFDIWQRGTSFTGLSNGSYSADRWVVYDSVGNINYNVIRNAGVFTGGYGASYTWNSGTGQRSIIQFIENVTRFKVGSSVTVSFEAYTSSTPYSINVGIQGIRGTWASATAVVASPIALTNTKAKYSVTLSVPDWSSIGIDWAHLEDTKLALEFNFAADTNGKNFIISNVQLEEGSVATPFEQRPYGLELSLCQRYYQQSTEGSDVTTTSWYSNNGGALCVDMEDVALCGLRFPIEMRVSPTFTPYVNGTALRIKSYGGDATRIVSSVDVNKHGVSGFRHDGGYTIGRPYAFTWIANAEL